MQYVVRHKVLLGALGSLALLVAAWVTVAPERELGAAGSDFLRFSAPAGDRQATTNTIVDGVSAAMLPNGRLVTPAGKEVNVQAPKPFGLALSPDGSMLATLNSTRTITAAIRATSTRTAPTGRSSDSSRTTTRPWGSPSS